MTFGLAQDAFSCTRTTTVGVKGLNMSRSATYRISSSLAAVHVVGRLIDSRAKVPILSKLRDL